MYRKASVGSKGGGGLLGAPGDQEGGLGSRN